MGLEPLFSILIHIWHPIKKIQDSPLIFDPSDFAFKKSSQLSLVIATMLFQP